MPTTYVGQPANLVDNVYYELNNALYKIDVDTKVSSETMLSQPLQPTTFYNYDRNIFVVSQKSLFCLLPETCELFLIAPYIETNNVFQYSINQMASIRGQKMVLLDLENYSIQEQNTDLLEQRTYKIDENSYLQISDNITYSGEVFRSQSSYKLAIPFSNSDFLAITDLNGRMELLQSPIFAKAFENCSHIRYVKQ